MTLSFAYLGLMRAILDATAEYLIGADGRVERRDHPLKQQGWAAMNLKYDEPQSLCYRVLGEVGVDPSVDAVRRAWSSVVSTMEGAPELASTAIRICGGRSMLRPSRPHCTSLRPSSMKEPGAGITLRSFPRPKTDAQCPVPRSAISTGRYFPRAIPR